MSSSLYLHYFCLCLKAHFFHWMKSVRGFWWGGGGGGWKVWKMCTVCKFLNFRQILKQHTIKNVNIQSFICIYDFLTFTEVSIWVVVKKFFPNCTQIEYCGIGMSKNLKKFQRTNWPNKTWNKWFINVA